MADLFSLESGLTEGYAASQGSTLDTGDLRRKYDFGARVSELAIAQDPFFRFVSKLSKKPTDDPQFKFTERRPSFHKRYAYVTNHGATAPTSGAGTDATVDAGAVDAGDTYYLCMGGDYESAGNIGNVYGNSTNEISVGDSGTQPAFFIPGQLVKVPYGSSSRTFSGGLISQVDDYLVAKVTSVDTSSVSNYAVLKTEIVRGTSSAIELASYYAADNAVDGQDISGMTISSELEAKRSYVIGTAFAQGSGYPETWKDNPFSTGFGNTQIWKTAMAMDNTTRATVLKYDSNEWARVWKEKLIEHKWDIEQSLLFNGAASSSGSEWTTDGVVSYISSYGNQFTLPLSTKSQDSFLDDLSTFLDPRYNNSNATLFFVSTSVYNWLHKLSGYFGNNVGMVQFGGGTTPSPSANSLGRADLSMLGKKKVFGVDITVISTPYGDMNIARNIHLDGTDIGILAVNMKHLAYRPLVGNGLNRDTAVYVGVQTLENSGVDRRVDLIQTEAALQVEMPEAHGIWIAS